MRRIIFPTALLALIIILIEITGNAPDKGAPVPALDSPVTPGITGSVTDIKLLKPEVLTHYPLEAPAPDKPILRWTIPPGSVYFEIEFLTAYPENPNDINPSVYRFFASREVFTNGYSVNLSQYRDNLLYWRVRALDLDGNPVGVFSDANPIYVDHSLTYDLKPVANTGYSAAKMTMPLYPVYSWIPIYGAVAYELELTNAPPEKPNGTASSKYQIRKYAVNGPYDYYFAYYDQIALSTPGTYYWRVRGLDKAGGPVGVFSDAEQFTVSLAAGSYAATFGDSTTQGGGDMIYSPANVESDYRYYLKFQTMNLGRSADNAAGMLARFETDVLPFHPQYLIILGGIPELTEDVPAAQVIDELAAIRDKCRLHGIRPIFLTLYPVNPSNIKRTANHDTVSDWQEKFTQVNAFLRKQKYCIDIEPYFQGADHNLPSYLSADGIHLGIEGKKMMGQVINDNWQRVTQ